VKNLANHLIMPLQNGMLLLSNMFYTDSPRGRKRQERAAEDEKKGNGYVRKY